MSTRRLVGSEPSLQNIPIRTEQGRRIRDALTEGEPSTLIECDYADLEARVVAKSIRKKAKNPTTECECGQPLPVHLADLVDENYTHVCSCRKAWKVTSGLFVCIGDQDNPVADFDEAVEGAKCQRCKGGIDYIWVNLFHQITGKTDQFPPFCLTCVNAVLTAARPEEIQHG
jgi:hypothetical protein